MQRAISETQRRRGLQLAYNDEHGIDPQTIRKAVTDILAISGRPRRRRCPARTGARVAHDTAAASSWPSCPATSSRRLILTLEEEMHDAAADLRFEYAARLRDEIKDLKRELRDVG